MQPMTSWVQLSIVSSRSFKLAPVLSQQVFFVSSWLVCQNMVTTSSNCKHFHNALSKTWFCVITGTENAHVAYLSAALADEKVYLPATLTASVCRSALFLFHLTLSSGGAESEYFNYSLIQYQWELIHRPKPAEVWYRRSICKISCCVCNCVIVGMICHLGTGRQDARANWHCKFFRKKEAAHSSTPARPPSHQNTFWREIASKECYVANFSNW